VYCGTEILVTTTTTIIFFNPDYRAVKWLLLLLLLLLLESQYHSINLNNVKTETGRIIQDQKSYKI